MICYCLFQSELGLNQLQRTKISKKNLVFEVSISNRPIFCADRGSANENSDKRFFWPPEGHEVDQPRAKNLPIAISRSFLVGLLFPFVEIFVKIYYCLKLKEFKMSEILLLRLEFSVF